MKKKDMLKKITAVHSFLLLIGVFSGCSNNAPAKYFGVNFDGNGGTLVSGELHQKVSSANEIKPPVFELNGYSFDGWNIPIETINEPTTIKAQWMLETYEITYHLDGGTNSSSNPSHYNVTFDNIYLDGASKAGYNFDYWSLSNGREISVIYSSDTKNIDLYANYTTVGYSISYELNGGSFLSTAPTTYTIEQEKQIPNAQKEGYTFVGWSLSQKGQRATKDYVIKKGTSGNIKLYAVFSANSYTVSYDVNGGDELNNNIDTFVFGCYYQLATPNKNGYEFVGWTHDGTQIEMDGVWNIPNNINLFAKWSASIYYINYKLNGGTNNPSNPSSYTIEDTFVLENPTKNGYSFLGWFNDDNQQITSISPGTTGSVTLTARWNEGDKYIVTLEANGGFISDSQINVQFDHDYNLPEASRFAYGFAGWYNGKNKVESSGIWDISCNVTLVAMWNAINYQIVYELNGGTNNPSNPSSYTIEDTFVLENPTKNGYSFLGWYSGDTEIRGVNAGTTSDLYIEAKWDAVLNNLSVVSDDLYKGTVSILSGNGFSDEEITVLAEPKTNCVFVGWYQLNNKISNDEEYTFIMPTNDYLLTARFLEKEEAEHYGIIPKINFADNTLTYGLYPQTNVSNPELLDALNKLTSVGSEEWCFYDNEYYAKVSATPYNTKSAFHNGNSVKFGQIYWFKCEPILWNILNYNDDHYYLLSSVLLESCYFSSSYGTNDYYLSHVKGLLDYNFYGSAFSMSKDLIQTTKIDTGSSEIFTQKVFLPNYEDYLNCDYGFSATYDSSITRYCKVTDWAIAKGASYSTQASLQFNGAYWTRSPASASDFYVYCIGSSGTVFTNRIDYTSYCVRPAIYIENRMF